MTSPSSIAFFSMPQGQELIIILLIILVLFGGAKLPELARGLGKSIREFKKAKDGQEDDKKGGDKKDDAPPPGPPPQKD